MNSFIYNSEEKESFIYEPKLRNDNKYNVEIKSPNFENYNNKLNKLVRKMVK